MESVNQTVAKQASAMNRHKAKLSMYPNKYKLIASEVATDTKNIDVVIVPECGCSKGYKFPFGENSPEYYKNLARAIQAWISHAIHRRLYWAIHFNGKHIIHVRNHYGITANLGMRWMERRDYKA